MKTKISAAFLVLAMVACDSDGIKENEGSADKPTSTKMILKTSNNMYVALNTDSTLVANQTDAAKAIVIEKVDNKNGTFALKTANGRFISDNRPGNNTLIANRTSAGEWEQFTLITGEGSKISIKSSAGKFVCADQKAGGPLSANRDQAGDWETFTAEPK